MRRSSVLFALALACARTSAPPGAPVPSAVEPKGTYLGTGPAVVLHGQDFTPAAVQRLNGGSEIEVDAVFRAFLGNVELEDVSWVDSHTLTAVVPPDLAAGTYALSVEGPYGLGMADGVFLVSDAVPAALTASASAPQRARLGLEFSVAQTVTNVGGMTAQAVAAGSPVLSGSAQVQPPAGTIDILPGASFVFIWRIRAGDSGVLDVMLPVAGVDEVDGRAVVAETNNLVSVVTGPHVVATPQPAPASAVVGMRVPLTIGVTNDGGTDALGVRLDDPSGAANVRVISSPLPQDVPAGATRTFQWTIEGTSPGAATLGCGGSGADPDDGTSFPVSAVQWTPIVFMGGLPAALTVPPGVLRGEVFAVTLKVNNPGTTAATAVQASATLSGGAASSTILLTAPAAADIPGGQTVAFVWTYQAGSPGTLQIDAGAAGTDASSGAPLGAAASASTQVSDAALVAQDPFGDGGAFSYVFAYAGKVYLGPSADGTRAVRVNPDGTGAETVQLAFLPDSPKNGVSPTPATFPSLGYLGCAPDTLQCGPDDEDGRGLFTAFSSGGNELLFAAGGRQNSVIKHAYATNDSSSSPTFSYIRTNLGGGMRGATAAAAMGDTLYVGVANGGGSGVPAVVPIFPPFGADSMGFAAFPSPLTNQTGTALVDSMAVYNGVLYAANDGGCARYDGSTWASCTPSASEWNLTPVSTPKITDFVPADKAVPQMAEFGGKLYLARNIEAGPQLWACTPILALPCGVSDWSLVAANGTGNPQLSQFDDATLNTLSLLVATSQHLYVGYDAPGGVVLYRSNTASPTTRADFGAWAVPGLGSAVKQILDARALTFAGNDSLYLTARDNALSRPGPVQVYRLAP